MPTRPLPSRVIYFSPKNTQRIQPQRPREKSDIAMTVLKRFQDMVPVRRNIPTAVRLNAYNGRK